MAKITDDVIDALQYCRLKAFLRLRGETGAQCGYEKLLIEQRADAQRRTIEKIRRESNEAEMTTGLSLSATNLHKGIPLILGTCLNDDRHAISFDAVRKVDGHSALEPSSTSRSHFARRAGFAPPIVNNSQCGRFSWRGCRGRFRSERPPILGATARGRRSASDPP